MRILRGQTDNKILNDKRIHIWDGNTSREFLDTKKSTSIFSIISGFFAFIIFLKKIDKDIICIFLIFDKFLIAIFYYYSHFDI